MNISNTNLGDGIVTEKNKTIVLPSQIFQIDYP